MTRPRILVVAGEPSGDRWGSYLARELNPHADLEGTGSAMMAAAGVNLFARSEDFNALGPLQSLARLGTHVQLMRKIVSRCKTGRYSAAVLIDYPGFNLRLAARLKEMGLPVLLYVAPQLWAWGNPRMKGVLCTLDRIAAILPFEPSFFRGLGVDVDFVGHPALDAEDIGPTETCESGLLGLAPGAREGERRRMLPVMVATANLMRARDPGLKFEVAVTSGSVSHATRDGDELRRRASGILTKSGTYSLEVALTGVPSCVMYKLDSLSYQVMKRRVGIERIAMANILLERDVVPEFIQNDAQPRAMAEAMHSQMNRKSESLEVARELREVLGGSGASAAVAQMTMELAV